MSMSIIDQPVVGVSEVGKLLGVSRQRAFQIVDQPGFPAPYATLDQGRCWRTSQFLRWATKHGREVKQAA